MQHCSIRTRVFALSIADPIAHCLVEQVYEVGGDILGGDSIECRCTNRIMIKEFDQKTISGAGAVFPSWDTAFPHANRD